MRVGVPATCLRTRPRRAARRGPPFARLGGSLSTARGLGPTAKLGKGRPRSWPPAIKAGLDASEHKADEQADVLSARGAGGLAIRGGILRVGGYAAGILLLLAAIPFLSRHLGSRRVRALRHRSLAHRDRRHGLGYRFERTSASVSTRSRRIKPRAASSEAGRAASNSRGDQCRRGDTLRPRCGIRRSHGGWHRTCRDGSRHDGRSAGVHRLPSGRPEVGPCNGVRPPPSVTHGGRDSCPGRGWRRSRVVPRAPRARRAGSRSLHRAGRPSANCCPPVIRPRRMALPDPTDVAFGDRHELRRLLLPDRDHHDVADRDRRGDGVLQCLVTASSKRSSSSRGS